MYLSVFNPDNDLALGNNSAYYQAPESVLKMASDLAVLPQWYETDSEDCIVLVSDVDSIYNWAEGLPIFFQIQCQDTKERTSLSFDRIRPWGWNKALLKRIQDDGLVVSELPDNSYIEKLRMLSSRQRAVELLSSFPTRSSLCGTSKVCFSIADIEDAAGNFSGEWNAERKLLKIPWSGSGKGLRWTSKDIDTSLRNWCLHVLHSQHALIIEPYYCREVDFAMEFVAKEDGIVQFCCYSLFHTNESGAYKGNILMKDSEIEDFLKKYVSSSILTEVKTHLESQLTFLLAGSYVGVLGIDMMICRFDDAPIYRLHPCVEINLRMNMGIVANRIYNRWIYKGSKGVYKVDYFKSPELLKIDHEYQISKYPIVVEDNKIKQGYLSLSPVSHDTLYRAAIWIEE